MTMAPFNFKAGMSKLFGQRPSDSSKDQATAPPSYLDPSNLCKSPQNTTTTGPTIVPSIYDSHSTTTRAINSPHQTNLATTTPPNKYVKIDGVVKLNQEYDQWRESQGGRAKPTSFLDQALPVVTNMEDYEEFSKASTIAGGKEVPLAESTAATIEILQEPEITSAAGMQADEMVDELGAVLNKWDIPMGLVNKLILLTELDGLEFIVDDFGSMSMKSDIVDTNDRPQTRWQEVRSRLKAMIEIIAYVPCPQINISFLNRRDQINLTRDGLPPKVFLKDAYAQIDRAFLSGPSGTTPILEKMKASLIEGSGRKIARYLFCDGEPNGGNPVKAEFIQLLLTRPNPDSNPITFLSCTGEDHEVEWLKDAEEIIPYCAECDDFKDETDEVRKDQGAALPFTYGFYLICSLVAAMCPDDLDAMDESIPFTKTTLDNLLGIEHDEAAYHHYFYCFLQAQRSRPVENDIYGKPKRTDQLKRDFNWGSAYEDFLRTPLANQIPAVQSFKKQLKQ